MTNKTIALLTALASSTLAFNAYAQEPVAPAPQTTRISPEPGHPKSALKTKKRTTLSSIKKQGNFGIGLLFATRGAFPVSFKYFIFDYLSIEVNGPISHAVYGILGIGIDTDLLYEGASFFNNSSVDLAWQLGGGLEIGGAFYKVTKTNHDNVGHLYNDQTKEGYFEFGLHANIGFQVMFPRFPFDAVLEWRPGAYFSRYDSPQHQTHSYRAYGDFINFAIGARYYF